MPKSALGLINNIKNKLNCEIILIFHNKNVKLKWGLKFGCSKQLKVFLKTVSDKNIFFILFFFMYLVTECSYNT